MAKVNEKREKYLVKVLELYRSGLTNREIQKKVPVARTTMRRWIEKYAKQKETEGTNYSDKKEAYYNEVIRLHFAEGYGEEKIARIIPISHSTVSRWIAKFVSEKRRERGMKQKKDRTEKPAMTERKEDLKAEIARLQKQLKQEEMRAVWYK